MASTKSGGKNTKHVGTTPWEEAERRREIYLEKPLPSSEESERVILGAILLDNTVMLEASAKLVPDDFYSPLNRRVFAAMIALSDQLKQIDPILIGEELKKEGSLDSIGGITTITNLTFGLPHFTNVEEYIKVVYDKARVREAIRTAGSFQGELLAEEADDAYEVISAAADALSAIADGSSDEEEFVMVADMIDDRLAHALQVQQTGNPITGIPLGFTELDAQLGGCQRTDLIIVAGRPSMGKTALALCGSQNAAFRHDVFVAVFTIEMGKQQLVDRTICSEAGINGLAFRSGMISNDAWGRIHEAENFLKAGMLALDDSPTLCPSQVRQKIRRLAKQKGRMPDMVVIDYIQLMNADPGARFDNRQQEMTLISRQLKAIAKKFNIPVIAVSQLSRAPETRSSNGHRPMMSDLRESGAIEQDADVVMFVYREDYYPNADGSVSGAGEAEIIIGKQRNGPTGMVKLSYDKESTRFANLSYDDY